MRNEGNKCHLAVSSLLPSRTVERSMAKSERLTGDLERQRPQRSNVLRRNIGMLNKWTSLTQMLAIQ
jgi:hypothetical protein